MQGYQRYQAQLFHYVDIESFIPHHHLLRKINQSIDLSFIRKLTESFYCSANGRPSIDPELFFRMILIGYLYNIQSDRQLCEEIHYNLAYRWFCRLNLEDKIPDHSSLTKIRDRLGLKAFQQFFHQIIEQCKQEGLVKGECVMTDSTLVDTNASLDSLINNDPEKIDPIRKRSLQLDGFSQCQEKISNKTHTSQTDPDATLAAKKGTSRHLKYKAHITIDTQSRVILDTKITTGACHDSQVYLNQLQSIIEQHAITIKETIADRAYGGGAILQSLLDKNIQPTIPLYSSRSGGFVLGEKEGFVYDAVNDRYQCLAGKWLVPYPSLSDGRVTYHSNPKECLHCLSRQTCQAMSHSSNNNLRIVNRNIHQKLFEWVQQRLATTEGCQKLIERFWKMEGIISEAKNRHCLFRAKYRGLIKTQIQAYMSACAQNMKRLAITFLWLLFLYCYQQIYFQRVKNNSILVA